MTGAAGGIGAARVTRLLEESAEVVATDRAAPEIAGAIRLAGDLTAPVFCDARAPLAAKQMDGLTLLCNNAGVITRIDTPLNTDDAGSVPDPVSFRAGPAKIHPPGRIGTPEDVAALICWLASDEAGFVLGQVWTIDGGRMSQLSLP